MAPGGLIAEEAVGASGVLLGRDRELSELYALVDGIGESGGALVVRGDAGIGKSALLAAAKERAQSEGLTVVSTAGALSEAQLAFSGLHQLLLPLLDGLERLPDPRRRALEGAFGIAEADAPDVFLIGLAALGLIAERAVDSALLFVVDDAHWLDRQAVTLCLDADGPGRAATARAVENATRARTSPCVYVAAVVTKDPDELVRGHGVEAWSELLNTRECGVTWRAAELLADAAATDPPAKRRTALVRAGSWLGSLPPRLALEQEDAVRTVAERCGYSADAAARAFRARFFRDLRLANDLPHGRIEPGMEL
jgi:hypothetical protein